MKGSILAVDFGERRIGLAVSDPMQIIARELVTLDSRKSSNIIKEIIDIAKDEEVVKIIVGYPFNLDGTISDKCFIIDKFILELSSNTELPIEKVDETFSSVCANDLINSRKKRRSLKEKIKNKGAIDRIAACYFLQDFLNG